MFNSFGVISTSEPNPVHLFFPYFSFFLRVSAILCYFIPHSTLVLYLFNSLIVDFVPLLSVGLTIRNFLYFMLSASVFIYKCEKSLSRGVGEILKCTGFCF
jgi:hypothetical protein